MWTRGESVVVTVLQNIQYSLLKQERVLAIIRTHRYKVNSETGSF